MAGFFPLLRRGIESLGYDPQMFPPIRYTRRALRSMGLELQRFGPLSIDWQVKRMFTEGRIDTLIDVGANRGQFGMSMRELGFRGTIHSFEPIPEVREKLDKVAARDGRWQVHGCALAAEPGRAQFNIGRFDQTSSLKTVDPREANSNEVLEVVRQIEVEIATLDSFVQSARLDPERTFLKIDVQGAEMEVLAGGRAFLNGLSALLTETSLTSAYEEGGRIEDLLQLIRDHGLEIAGMEPVYANAARRLLLELDVLALRPEQAAT
jgi:FkbM family methyltransferase